MSTPAGWYTDPSDASQQRYWDGTQWTQQTQAAPEAEPAQQPAAAHPVAQSQPIQHQPAAGGAEGTTIGGIRTDLLTDQRYAEVGSGQRVTKQNNRLLKVVLGEDLLAKQGSMVAFQGQIDFDHEGAGVAKFMKKAMTGEGLQLMRCKGRGELFLADQANQVHIVYLEGGGLTVNGRSILAFEPTLTWDIERVKGAGMAAGGLFNTRLEGRGWVAITTDGDPVVLRTDAPTFVDTDAVVAWSSNLQTNLNRTMKAKAAIGLGSGEAVQLTFQGDGIVIVQPSEGHHVVPG
ncbi:MAG: AIM24 family protein [Microthrixaceae bacterium]